MNLSDYLRRIQFEGVVAPTLNSLAALMRSHAFTVPFENLDVQLGRPLTTSPADAYKKVVERGRGGWCYEQNGLFGWALDEIGFSVTRLSAAVRYAERGDVALNNHLTLLVSCPGEPGDYLVDVGFGGSQLEPLPLIEGKVRHTPFELSLVRCGDGWRLVERYSESEVSYDFSAHPADEAGLSRKCTWLQTSPDSSFVLSLVAQRRSADSHKVLRGRVLTDRTCAGETSRVLESADELVSVLRDEFRLDVPEVRDVWTQVVARHTALFGD